MHFPAFPWHFPGIFPAFPHTQVNAPQARDVLHNFIIVFVMANAF